MNSSNLSLIHPDDIVEKPITPISNMSVDCLFEFRNIDYISPTSDETHYLYLEKESIDDLYLEPTQILNPNLKAKIGDGKMDYIQEKSDREMFTNAWNAITITNNWDFLAEETESFTLSKDPRVYEIAGKMEDLGYKGHSGVSFSLTMRSMQYLLHYGEDEFKKMF